MGKKTRPLYWKGLSISAGGKTGCDSRMDNIKGSAIARNLRLAFILTPSFWRSAKKTNHRQRMLNRTGSGRVFSIDLKKISVFNGSLNPFHEGWCIRTELGHSRRYSHHRQRGNRPHKDRASEKKPWFAQAIFYKEPNVRNHQRGTCHHHSDRRLGKTTNDK